MLNRILPVAVLILPALAMGGKEYQLQSPSGNIVAEINADKQLSYTVSYDGKQLLAPSRL